MIPRFLAFIELARPVNAVIAFASVLTGVFYAYGNPLDETALCAALSAFFLCAAANAGNDCVDIDIDRKNKPRRPLPSGRVSLRSAAVFAGLLGVTGLALAGLTGPVYLGIALTATALAALYNARLKKQGAIGNLVVSAVASLAFPYGGLLGEQPERSLFPASLAFLFHLGREIVKDIEDIPGDRPARSRSIPIRYGPTGALAAVTSVFVLLIVVTLVPVYFGWSVVIYLSLVMLVDLVILYALWTLWTDASAQNAGRISRLLKADMALGLLALLLGRT
ncbi:MAG: geranylgeranylglycerol-phosphate geranylgeranyltransferase [candidate division Zixibacteria bacterium]|nr:geranylgeranylglycerol-phosphate geranylgeranyltransferase [candidate division Zixibacteria bacterium]